ncbi:hypothetical protein KMW28_17815 [Flammeovirga yaeyamensis]|uniref:Outer membrane protein beta-barrel domain-containing protein n=1 Tax=Flammeovirga yaeyamensis TaxID=367791 RepID=A0AAX1N1S1_9BACT|nr:hypothetical protein [Flammeovirga yaeyamensis]MBB3698119.1 hypothetical protein [Flammeovirga yaeyamensis]NMF34522.1 hypothetical protein [Flammeovirga yaeyamensis]QWG01499.1 hypothetical protein KMW28_17815 [Flammeovirga yaeyamensis]
MKRFLFIFTTLLLFFFSFDEIKAQTSIQYYYGMGGLQQVSVWQNITQKHMVNFRAGYQDVTENNFTLSLGYGYLTKHFLPYLVFNKDITSGLNNYSINNGYYWISGGRFDLAAGWVMKHSEYQIDESNSSSDWAKKWSQVYWFNVYYNIKKYRMQIGGETGITSSGVVVWGCMINRSF